MCSMQTVFLFDLNACTDYLLKSTGELHNKLLSIRLACIRLLTDFSTKSSNFKWGFKFFDSSGSITQTMCKFAFSDVSLEAFETLENEICMRYERHIALLQALEASEKSVQSTNDICKVEVVKTHPVKILQLALTQILCEFQWESIDMWSPSTKKFQDKSLFVGKKNFLFVFSDFKDNDEVLFNYFGLDHLPAKHKFMISFLPQDLRESLFQKADIHLVFLNTCQDQKVMAKLSSSILPLLSESLKSVQGSMIPLFLLSQPLYNMQFLNNSENTLFGSKVQTISELCSSFHNSLMPFSSLFHQSLYHLFYSNDNSVTCKCNINVINEDVNIPIQVIKIFNKNHNLNEDGKNSLNKKVTWSKFVIQSSVSRSFHNIAYEILLCLPNDSKSDASEVGLMKLNKSLCLEGVNLLLECVTDCGISMPGLLTPLTTEAAVISILCPSINHQLLKSVFKNSAINSLKVKNIELENNSAEIQNFKAELKNSLNGIKYTEDFEDNSMKPFRMECMETWFKPTSVSNVASFIQSKSSKKMSKISSFYKMLQQSARNSTKLSSKASKKRFRRAIESNTQSVDNNDRTEEQLPENVSSFETENKDMEEMLSNLSYEELLSNIKNIYDSVIEEYGNIVTSLKRIVKLVINYYKKKNSNCIEEDVQNLFKNNFIMTARRISEKYEMSDTEEATKKKVKECQIQVLLIFEIEISKECQDRTNCVTSVSSLLRLMTFYCGITELQNFMHDVLLKNYSHQLYDILVEIGEELSISIFDDAESVNSPTDTVSSELMNEEEMFNFAASSSISEKSSSSTSSRKEKDNNAMERKLVRRRSDISDIAMCRQVLLPKSASKKKKRKMAASKSLRCSPRIASRIKESVSEKPRTVRRNLFPGSSQTPKKNKHSQPTTPRSKKRESHILKTKYVAETPSHKQSHSALQRRKSFMDKLSNSPKVIAESPQIVKTVKEGANKELLEKLQKVRHIHSLSKPTESSSQGSSCPSVNQYTPESKRRLSLRLFSKFLASPTARVGIKKCTKRLFDQISPNKDCENVNKKHKSNNDYEQASYSAVKK